MHLHYETVVKVGVLLATHSQKDGLKLLQKVVNSTQSIPYCKSFAELHKNGRVVLSHIGSPGPPNLFFFRVELSEVLLRTVPRVVSFSFSRPARRVNIERDIICVVRGSACLQDAIRSSFFFFLFCYGGPVAVQLNLLVILTLKSFFGSVLFA